MEKIAQHVHEKEATKPDEEEVVSEDDDDDDDNDHHNGPLVPNTFQGKQTWSVVASTDGAPNKGEKLRAGNVIEYTNTIMVTGDPRGCHIATILEVRPKQEY